MEKFNIGDKVYMAGFMSETGTIVRKIEGTNDFEVNLDNDPFSRPTIVNILELSHVEEQ